jgi:hypothetical protein
MRNPYLCYTEHGQHALFFAKLLAVMPDSSRYSLWQGQKVCVIQKEYPTATDLGKPKRQHWDIALLKTPLSSINEKGSGFDFLRLSTVIEFGMNEPVDHLMDDIERMSHPKSNTEYGFIVHFYRFSDAQSPFSGRDWSPHSKRIVLPKDISKSIRGKAVEVYYAVADKTKQNETAAWIITPDGQYHELPCG